MELVSSYKSRLTGIATAPPCGISSLVTSGRGLTRKIGCIDIATQMGRKKKIEDDYILGDTIGQQKFGSVCLRRSKVERWNLAILGIVTLWAVYEKLAYFHLVMEL